MFFLFSLQVDTIILNWSNIFIDENFPVMLINSIALEVSNAIHRTSYTRDTD